MMKVGLDAVEAGTGNFSGNPMEKQLEPALKVDVSIANAAHATPW